VKAIAELEKQDVLVTILRSQLAVLRVVRLSAAKEDLTTQQFGILRLLALRGALSMNVLSEELLVSPPVITGIVDRLESKDLVKRIGSTDDRRRTEVMLSASGKKVYDRTREKYRSSLQEALGRSLSRTEQETLARLLAKFAGEI
jgi:DNA-binding MarR family transcriptional regulator